MSSSSTSRWVTKRTPGPNGTARTPAAPSPATRVAGSAVGTRTMLVSGRRRRPAEGAQARGEAGGAGVVGGEVAGLAERDEPRGAHDAALPDAAAEHLAQPPGPVDERRRAGDHRPHRRAEALRQAHAHGVGARRQLVRRDLERGGGVPDPRAVEVHGQPGVARRGHQRAVLVDAGDGPARAVVGVLEAEQRRAQPEVGPGGAGGARHRGRCRAAGAAVVLERHREPAGEPRRGPELGLEHVRPGGREEPVTACQVVHERDGVRHAAGGGPERGLDAEQVGDTGLERGEGRVAVEDVVADVRPGHRLAHGGRGAGDRVGAQIDRPAHCGSFTTDTKKSSIWRMTSMKRSKSTGLATYAFA